MTKRCRGCDLDLPTSLFNVLVNKKKNTTQLSWKCKDCLKVYIRELMRKRRAAAPDEHRAMARKSMSKWNAANPEAHRAKVKAWRKANPSQAAVLRKNHKAKRASVPGRITSKEWADRLAEFNGHCAYCLDPLARTEIEHMQPLSRGGHHDITNVIPSCPKCNGRKKARNLLEFAREATAF